MKNRARYVLWDFEMVYIRTFYLQAAISIKPELDMSNGIFGYFQAHAESVSENTAETPPHQFLAITILLSCFPA